MTTFQAAAEALARARGEACFPPELREGSSETVVRGSFCRRGLLPARAAPPAARAPRPRAPAPLLASRPEERRLAARHRRADPAARRREGDVVQERQGPDSDVHHARAHAAAAASTRPLGAPRLGRPHRHAPPRRAARKCAPKHEQARGSRPALPSLVCDLRLLTARSLRAGASSPSTGCSSGCSPRPTARPTAPQSRARPRSRARRRARRRGAGSSRRRGAGSARLPPRPQPFLNATGTPLA